MQRLKEQFDGNTPKSTTKDGLDIDDEKGETKLGEMMIYVCCHCRMANEENWLGMTDGNVMVINVFG